MPWLGLTPASYRVADPVVAHEDHRGGSQPANARSPHQARRLRRMRLSLPVLYWLRRRWTASWSRFGPQIWPRLAPLP